MKSKISSMRSKGFSIVSFQTDWGDLTNTQVTKILQEICNNNQPFDEADLLMVLLLLLSRPRKRRTTRNIGAAKKRSSHLQTVVKKYTLS